MRRWLAADAIKPWQHRSWIFPRDPDFAAKAARVLDLYARPWQGQPLGADEYVISADEKSQLQALRRRHREPPPAPGGPGGSSSSTAAAAPWPTSPPTTSTAPTCSGGSRPRPASNPSRSWSTQVMTTEPYASARRVFWVVDNGSSHNGARSIDRMQPAWPTATLVHLPMHASWLNQVEIYFSILQRKAISPNDFADLDQLSERILGFPGPLQHHRDTVRLDLHPRRPQRLPQPPRPQRTPHPTPHDPRRTYDRDH